jgi:hypothetical protein
MAASLADAVGDRVGMVEAYEGLRDQLITHGTCRAGWGAAVLLRAGLAAWIEAYQHWAAVHQRSIAARPTVSRGRDQADVVSVLATMTLAHVERTRPCSLTSPSK